MSADTTAEHPSQEELLQISTWRFDDVWYAGEPGVNVTGRAGDELQAAINYLEFVRDSR